MRRTRHAVTAVLMLALPLLVACGRGQEPAADAAPGDSAMDGLSSEQIEQQAEPMSPEQAEQLGIIDTTIHLEQLTSPEDSAVLRGRPTAADTIS